MSSVILENFSQKAFSKEIRIFMKENSLSLRKFVKLAKISLATLQRVLGDECKMTIETGAKIQKAMRTFKAGAA